MYRNPNILFSGGRLQTQIVMLMLILPSLLIATTSWAQLNGTYTVGGGGASYASIEAAVSALATSGVSGAVTFRINGGTYTPPVTGYILPAVAGMSATNTVTFKPAAGAVVTIDGSVFGAIFDFNGGDFFIVDGSNAVGGTSRNLKVINRNTLNAVARFTNGATKNVVKNTNLIGVTTQSTIGVVNLGTSTIGGNSNNTISANTIGDSAGTLRASIAIYASGSAGTNINAGNLIEGNDIINFGSGSATAYGIYTRTGNQQVKIFRNRIRIEVQAVATGSAEGIRFENSTDALQDTIAWNRIWKIQTTSTTSPFRGITIAGLKIGETMSVHDNMIALTAGGTSLLVGIAVEPSTASTVNVHYNSVYVGGTSTSSNTSHCVSISSRVNVGFQNNIAVNKRISAGTSSNRVLTYAASQGSLTSNHNVFHAGGASTTVVFEGAVNHTTLQSWLTTGRDATTLALDPRYLDEAGGDLHISTTLRTAAEGTATPIAGITTDIDGNSRSATTPDRGADEGTFLPLLASNVAAFGFNAPQPLQHFRGGTLFNPTGRIFNTGSSTQTNVTARYRIWSVASGALVYSDVQNVPTVAPSHIATVTFAQNGGLGGSTSLAAGDYVIELRTDLPSDVDTTDNAIYGTITIRTPMSGIYTIDRNGAGARNYTSFTAALAALAPIGVNGTVTFVVAGGVYDATTETFPLTLTAVQGSSAANNVVFRPAAGSAVMIMGSSSSPVLSFDGADWVTLDGASSSGGTSRDWRVVNAGTGPAVRFINGATRNTVKNMNLLSAATFFNVGIVQFSTSTTGEGSSFNTITANTIGDQSGAIRATVGIHAQGTSGAAANVGNRIEGNDIVNFGNSAGFGIIIQSGNKQVKILRNRITIPNGVYTMLTAEAIRFDNKADSETDTIAYNTIWGATSDSYSGYSYGINIMEMAPGSTMAIHDNMISLVRDEGGTFTGLQIQILTKPGTTPPATIHADHNTIYIGGVEYPALRTSNAVTVNNAVLVMRNNILVNTRRAWVRSYLINRLSATGVIVSDGNLLYADDADGDTIAYALDVSTPLATLAEWKGTGQDAGSVSAPVPFQNISAGDLHIDSTKVFVGESAGQPLGYADDIDGQPRDMALPDLGADDGDFNGGGLRIVSPNGGELLPVGYLMPTEFTANRAMTVRFEISTDQGESWLPTGVTFSAVPGTNRTIVPTPDVATDGARVRVMSQRNSWERDLSDADFSLLRPELIVRSPNGGEQLVPTDTVPIRWSSRAVPPTFTVDLEYTTDDGSTWHPIASALRSDEAPAINTFDWVVPNTPSEEVRVRVRIPNTTSAGVSDARFTITEQPRVALAKPAEGQKLFIGEKSPILWTYVTTEKVHVDFSTDGGATWSRIAHDVPANADSLLWSVSDAPTASGLVRVTNAERPRFFDIVSVAIVRGFARVTAPNGGESFRPGEPVTVTWIAPHSGSLRVEYTADGGLSWSPIASAVAASEGELTFRPLLPTTRARVRVIDNDRPWVNDISDASFEIQAEPSIIVYTPSAGEKLQAGSTTWITWESYGVQQVSLDYSSNGGASWQPIASGQSAAAGGLVWTVPTQKTTAGMVRVREIGGATIGESGIFSIVEPGSPSVQLVSPNGGEKYSVDEDIEIRWSATGVERVTIHFSENDGESWQPIVSGIDAGIGSYMWKAPRPGTRYRIRVAASPTVGDRSESSFEVMPHTAPSITVNYPNGGESLTAGEQVEVRWSAVDLPGSVTLTYSTNGGESWSDIATVASASGRYTWTVPNAPTGRALVGVSAGPVADRSDALFTIVSGTAASLRLITPNGGEIWNGGEMRDIEWTSAGVASVRLTYSTNGGGSWESIALSVPAASGRYAWRVPVLAADANALVRVEDVSSPNIRDESDAPFSIRRAVAGITDGVMTGGDLHVIGNFPNPFSSRTEIRWMQPVSADVELRLIEGSGRLVRTQSLGHRESGAQSVGVSAGTLPSGMYIYELRVGNGLTRGTMMIVR